MSYFIKVRDKHGRPWFVNVDQIAYYGNSSINFPTEDWLSVLQTDEEITALIEQATPTPCGGNCDSLRDVAQEMYDGSKVGVNASEIEAWADRIADHVCHCKPDERAEKLARAVEKWFDPDLPMFDTGNLRKALADYRGTK